MGKRKTKAYFISALMLLACLSTLHASFSYRLDSISFDPIHGPYLADKWSGNLMFNYIVAYEGYPSRVWQENGNGAGGVMEFPLEHDRFRAEPGMAQMKIAETFTLFRNTFSFDSVISPVKWDLLTLQGGVSIVFDGEISDLLGYDGCYFVGTALSVADMVSVRFGLNHWCTHYGDAIQKNLSPADRALFDNNYKYLRNDLAFGLSVRPVEWLRLYGEYQWLPRGEFLKPVIFSPDHGKNSLGWGKGYNAAIANVGIELSYPFWKGHGNTAIAYDLHMYEEGKIIYRDENGNLLKVPQDASSPAPGEIYYDEDAPWLFEHSIVFSQGFTDYFSLEIGWHTGRSPLNSMFFENDSSWVHIGMRFDPELTCRAWSTAE